MPSTGSSLTLTTNPVIESIMSEGTIQNSEYLVATASHVRFDHCLKLISFAPPSYRIRPYFGTVDVDLTTFVGESNEMLHINNGLTKTC